MDILFTRIDTTILIFIFFEITFLVYQLVHVIQRPSDARRRWYLILLAICIFYNVIVNMTHDGDDKCRPIDKLVLEGLGLITFWCFSLYYYKSYNLKLFKAYLVSSTLVFLLGPFVLIILLVACDQNDITNTYLGINALGYACFFLTCVTTILVGRIKLVKSNKIKPGKIAKIKFVALCVVLCVWLFYPITIFTDHHRQAEQFLLNIIIIAVGLDYLIDAIQKSKEEYSTLLELNAKVNKKTRDTIDLAHDSRVPLELMTNYFRELREKYGPDHNALEFDAVIGKLVLLENEVQNIFDIQRIQIGANIYSHDRRSNISEIAKVRLDLFATLAEAKKISLVSNVGDNVMVLGNADALARIINNLLDNAIRHTPQGGRVSLQVFAVQTNVILTVEDNGTGIPTELHGRIFTPYVNQNNPQEGRGLGIGLSIAKQMVTDMGGNIFFESVENVGTKFTLEFNRSLLEQEHSNALPDQDSHVSRVVRAVDSITIPEQAYLLIVEDDEVMLKELADQLAERYNVYVARNGKEALHRARTISSRIDVVISDIIMEPMDGIELCRAFTEDDRLAHIPFIFLTARSGDFNKTSALSYGAIDYFEKPINYTELISKIEAILTTLKRHREAVIRTAYNTLLSPNSRSNQPPKSQFEYNCKYYGLTEKEIEMVLKIRAGESRKVIAVNLGISTKTVDSHITKIFRKVHVSSTVQLLNKLSSPSSTDDQTVLDVS